MKIPDLSRKITFQNKNVEVDEVGNHKSVWTDYPKTSAHISFQGKGEKTFPGMEVDRSDIFLIARLQNSLKNINTSGYRILFDDEKYNIISIDFMNCKNRFIKFRCRKVSR